MPYELWWINKSTGKVDHNRLMKREYSILGGFDARDMTGDEAVEALDISNTDKSYKNAYHLLKEV